MNVQHNKLKGFTIIEVVLVLAIAGLIFLMVFIALPALQSSQRDTSRKNDVSTVASSITTYTGNNRGSFPTTTQLTGTTAGTVPGGYITAVSNNTTTVKVGTAKSTSVAVADGEIIIVQGTTCGATGAGSGSATQTLAVASSTRQFTTITYLEAGGGTSYCQGS